MSCRFITLDEAQDLGYKELYFTWNGLGDNLALLYAAELYYKANNKKVLISSNIPELYENCFGVDLIESFTINDIRKNEEVLIDTLARYGIQPIFIHALDYKESFDNPGRNNQTWADKHFFARYCERFGLSETIEINPRIILTEQEKKYGRVFKDNQIAIMSNGLQKYKTFPIAKMQELVDVLKDKYNFIQIGLSNDVKLKNVLDYRGKVSIRQIASILYNSNLFVGNISGFMHLARAVSCKSVIAYSLAESLNYDSYPCNKNVFSASGCNACAMRFRYPRIGICYDNYSCIKNINVKDMIDAVCQAMSENKGYLETENIELKSDKVIGLELYYASKKGFPINKTSDYFNNNTIKQAMNVNMLGIFDLKIENIQQEAHI
ncbi:MAG: hypothetical protein LBT79_08260 [Elusimicrobiota bacterium]|jgi:CDP-glycerol glycerophosphotransferase|nr:hypothetical protein [Elusimicrobiota bacterium]